MNAHGSEPRASEREAIEATAAAWLAQRDAEFSPEDAAAFARWRAADPRHEAAVARLAAAWRSLEQLRDFRPEARVHPDRDLLRTHSGNETRRRIPVLATLALAASLALAFVWWQGLGPFAPTHGESRYATTIDGYERVTLADGSLLELNADSEVSVHFTASERRVRLRKGEAHFTVTKNEQRPFNVMAGSIDVRAVGTAFNVRLGAKDIEVLVTEGKVQVAEHVARDAAPTPGTLSAPALLSANERVVIAVDPPTAPAVASAIPEVEKVAPEAIRSALAWQGPRLVFADTPLAEAAAQFNQRNSVQLIVADPELATLRIGGSFRAENIEAFVRLLASGNEIVVERPQPDRIVLRGAK